MAKTKKRKKKIYSKKDYSSGEGMLTSVWGPPLWHFLTCISFNYPVKPTSLQKKQYKEFILSLKHILPCRYCRENLKENLKVHPLTRKDLKNRENFSKWMFNLHELVNKMLGKTSGLKYCDVRDRYEHFRSRCTNDTKKIVKIKSHRRRRTRKKEKGCVEPLYGKKSKCIIKIVPKSKKCKTFQMDKKCIKKKL